MARVKGVYQPITNHNDLTNRGNVGHSSIDLRTSGYVSGGPPTWQSVSTCRIPSGHKAIDPDTGALITAGANYDCVLSASGALGLDTGTEAVSTWYYLWLCSGASGTTGVWSASATAPTLPAGYAVNKARVGDAWRNDGASNLWPEVMVMTGNRCRVFTPISEFRNTATAGSWVDGIDISAYVPPAADVAFVYGLISKGSNTGYCQIDAAGSSSISGSIRTLAISYASTEDQYQLVEVPLITPQQISCNSSGTVFAWGWRLAGWEGRV